MSTTSRTTALSILIGAMAISYSIYHQSSPYLQSNTDSTTRTAGDASSSSSSLSSFMVTIEQAFNTTELSMLSFDDLFGQVLDSTEENDDDALPSKSSFRAEWDKLHARFNAMIASSSPPATNDASAGPASSVGARMLSRGVTALHPVFLVPGFVTSGLELWSGKQCAYPTYFRKKIWGSLETFRSFLSDRECWKEHLSLDPVTGKDPEGIKLRPAQGFEAADFWTSAFWVWDRIIRNLSEIGYDSSNMEMVPYDWRLDYAALEERDGTFTKLKYSIEASVKTNRGQKAVIMGHSMGGQFVFTFLAWADDQEEGWCEQYIHSYLDLSGPLLGLPKAATALLSGEMKDTNALSQFAGLIENVFGRRRRHELFSSWGSLWSMAPLGGDDIWGVGADVDCGEGRVQSGTTCVDKVSEDGTVVKPHVPFLTFTDDKPDVKDEQRIAVRKVR